MREIINEFLTNIKTEKKATKNTIESYNRDLTYFSNYLTSKDIALDKIEPINIIMFINELKKENKSTATLNRTLSSVNTFIKFAYTNGYIKRMVSASKIAIPKTAKKEKQILTKKEVSKLREILSEEKSACKRDKLMFELMYTTGLKPTDIINIKMDDIDLEMGYITVLNSKGNEEVKYLESNTQKLAKEYVQAVRCDFVKGEDFTKKTTNKDTNTLFLNKDGEMLSRQSVWKTLKKYADKAEITKDLSSNILFDSYQYHKADK